MNAGAITAIRLLAADVDGTLIDGEETLPENVRVALQRSGERNTPVGLASWPNTRGAGIQRCEALRLYL